MSELQDIIEYICQEHEKSKTKEEKKQWKGKYKMVVDHYHERAGYHVYQTHYLD